MQQSHSSAVSIDWARAEELAATVSRIRVSDDFSSFVTPRLEAGDEEALRSYLWTAAICHSTKSGLRADEQGKIIKGWNFLLAAFSHYALEDNQRVSPDVFCDLTEPDLRLLLTEWTPTASVTLTDVDRRAELLRSTARDLVRRHAGSVSELLRSAGMRLGGPNGIYNTLDGFEAFNDPQHKKASAFILAVHHSHRVHLKDPEGLLPMIDYHRIRLLLRQGVLAIRDANGREALRSEESHKAIAKQLEGPLRERAWEVCLRLPSLSGVSPMVYDYLLWAHSRSMCRHEPFCVTRTEENGSYRELVGGEPSACPFETWCPGATDSAFRELWEPPTQTEDY